MTENAALNSLALIENGVQNQSLQHREPVSISVQNQLGHSPHDTNTEPDTNSLNSISINSHSDRNQMDGQNGTNDSQIVHDMLPPFQSPHIKHPPNQRLHEFHLSKFKNNTTCQMIFDLMSKNGVPESLLPDVKINLLVPKQRDVSTLSYVSFKLDVNDEVATIISGLNFWPQTCFLKNFIHKPKPIIDLSSSPNFPSNRHPNVLIRSFSTVKT